MYLINRNRFIVGLLVLSVVILFRVFYLEDYMSYFGMSSMCRKAKRVYDTELHGNVSEKYLDKYNHMSETIKIVSEADSKVSTILASEQSGVYQLLKVGDSIIKRSGELEIEIVRNGNMKTYRLDYMCDETNW